MDTTLLKGLKLPLTVRGQTDTMQTAEDIHKRHDYEAT